MWINNKDIRYRPSQTNYNIKNIIEPPNIINDGIITKKDLEELFNNYIKYPLNSLYWLLGTLFTIYIICHLMEITKENNHKKQEQEIVKLKSIIKKYELKYKK